jgi:hypothetical protein
LKVLLGIYFHAAYDGSGMEVSEETNRAWPRLFLIHFNQEIIACARLPRVEPVRCEFFFNNPPINSLPMTLPGSIEMSNYRELEKDFAKVAGFLLRRKMKIFFSYDSKFVTSFLISRN